MDVRLPDGTIIKDVPDGTTKADLVAKLQRNGMAVPSEWLQQEAPKQAGTANNDLASQLGLFVRSGLKGAMAIPAMGADAVGGLINAAQDVTLGQGKGFRFKQALPVIDDLLTRAGFPNPDTPMQRIVSKGTELGLGAGAAAKGASALADRATGATKEVLTRLAAAPETQAAAGIGSGIAGQQSAESGGGGVSQFVSALGGGLAGAGAVGGMKSLATAIAQKLSPAMQPAEIERRIVATLQQQGIDPASITPAMRAALMNDVREAMKLPGTLNDPALARLADYRRLGLTPTRGKLTLDPYDITQEMNAAKVAASTGARDARLPAIAQDNNAGLLRTVDEFGPINDRVALGERVTEPIMARDASMKSAIDSLYERARGTDGRSLPLNGVAFANKASQLIDDKLLGYAVPADVQKRLNQIAKQEVPFDVAYAEQLKTVLGDIGRADKGGATSKAMKLIRQALDDTPLMDSPRVNPGNLPAVPATVPPSAANAGQESIDAFNAARAAARQRFAWQEGTPAVTRTLEGAAPDNFIQREIVSKTAATADVQRLANEVRNDPQAMGAIRAGIVQHLKDAAIGKGNDSATGNFSGRQWLSALSDIGPQKLSLFFDAAELEQLRAIGRVGTLETFQPRGSAVNNSNTAAGVAGLLQGLSKNLGPLINKIPAGEMLLGSPMNNLTLSVTERGLTSVPRSIVTTPQRQGGLLDPLLLPALTSGGLLSTSP